MIIFHKLFLKLQSSPSSCLYFHCVRLPDRCPASRGDGAQDAGVDVDAFLTEPPAAPSAAVFGKQGSVQTRRRPHPEQEHEQRLSILARKTRTFLGSHSACGQRGTRGNRTEACAFVDLRVTSGACFQATRASFPTCQPSSFLSALTSP